MTVASTAPHTEDVGARAWADLATTALLGTARRPVPVPDTWPGALGQAAGQVTGDATERLLDLAGLLSAYRRSQVHTVPVPAPPAPAPAPSRPLPPAAARARLAEMFRTGSYHHRDEWLEEAARLGYRAPDDLLPELLEIRDTYHWNYTPDRAFARSEAARVEALLDERGWWLVDQELRSPPRPDITDLSVWTSGKLAAKAKWLATLRDIDPARARELLDAGWSKLAGSARAKLLPTLAAKLGPDDEPLINRALDDNRQDVRWTARNLLGDLHSPTYVARMTELTASWVRISASPHGDVEIVVHPPAVDTDGLHPRWFGNRYASPPDAADHVVGAAGATPIAAWRAWGVPDRIRTLSVRVESPDDAADPNTDRWLTTILRAWSYAGWQEGDLEWARSILHIVADNRKLWESVDERERTGLLHILPREEQAAFALHYLDHVDPEAIESVSFAIEVDGPWPTSLTLAVLRMLTDESYHSRSGFVGLLMKVVTQKADVADLPTITAFAAEVPTDSPVAKGLPGLLDSLTTRRTILEELR